MAITEASSINDTKTARAAESSATVNDLTVYRRDAETLEVFSWLTSGRCATVNKFALSDNFSVSPFLISKYMQGINTSLILTAVRDFLDRESASIHAIQY